MKWRDYEKGLSSIINSDMTAKEKLMEYVSDLANLG